MNNKPMKIGYIRKIDLELNPGSERFRLKEATFTRRTSSQGDKVYSKMLAYPIDYKVIVENANLMKNNQSIVLIDEPFLLDDELRERVTKWVDWANITNPSVYDPFGTEL